MNQNTMVTHGEKSSEGSQVAQQICVLEESVGKAEALAGALAERLISVLRSEPPPAAHELSTAQEDLVCCADQIRNQAVRIDNINSRLESILNRLEN